MDSRHAHFLTALTLAAGLWLGTPVAALADPGSQPGATSQPTAAIESPAAQPSAASHTQPSAVMPSTQPASAPTTAGSLQGGTGQLVMDDGGHKALPSGSDNGPPFGPTLISLLVVLVLAGGALVVVKRILPRVTSRGGMLTGKRSLKVLETAYLGPRKSLHLVQVGDRRLLIGGGTDRLSLLADVTGSAGMGDKEPSP